MRSRLAICAWILAANAVSASAQQSILLNGGFDTGNLSGWTELAGAGEGNVAATGLGINCPPVQPFIGSFLFSSSTQDGASALTREITIGQSFDLSDFPACSGTNWIADAQGWFLRCTSNSLDEAQIILQALSGGPQGTVMAQAASGLAVPPLNQWGAISVPVFVIPSGADTLSFSYQTVLDQGFSSIDIVADSFTLVLRCTFSELCNGDGGDQAGCTDCPCANNAPAGSVGGCLNTVGQSARLIPSGTPSLAADTMRMEMSGGVANAFAILSSGNNLAPINPINPCFALGTGIQSATFDGLRCAVGGVQRHGTRPMDMNGDVGVTTNGWGPPNGPPGGLIAQGGFGAGQTRFYQAIYRDEVTLGCMTGLNTTQAVSVTFQP